MNTYLDLALSGKNNWWRYVLGILVILVAWQLVGAIPTMLLIFWVILDGNSGTGITSDGIFSGVNVNISFIVMMLASWAFVAGLFFVMRVIHQRKFISLVTPDQSVNWKRILQGFLLWFLLSGIIAVLEARLYPGRYVFTLDVKMFLPFLFLALVLIPIQTSTEELFFRGYFLQGMGLRIRNIFVLSFLSGVVFMLPHLLNPEAKLNYLLMGIYYFSIGAGMAFVSLRDQRLELALGMHAANNLFTGLFANAVVTVMPSPSLFTVMELDVVYSTAASLVAMLIFIFVFEIQWRRKKSQTDGAPAHN